jgi:hypothetical protein
LADGLHAEKNLAHMLKSRTRLDDKAGMDTTTQLERALRYAQRLSACKGTREVLARRREVRARIIALCNVLGLRATRQDSLVLAIADLHKRATLQSPAL